MFFPGIFNDGDGQKEMVWTVRGAAGLGLAGKLRERVLMALLYTGVQDGFKSSRMEFTMYQILKILGLSVSRMVRPRSRPHGALIG